jgi:YaiO family outer membrane protein
MLKKTCTLALVGLFFSALCVAQDAKQLDAPMDWSASLSSGQTKTQVGTAQERSITLRRYTPLGSIAIEQLQLKRFGSSDSAFALDAYPRLWQGAYANLRYQHATSPDLYPGNSWRAELYQNVGGGWELAASHDVLGFTSNVKIEGVALGKYWGNFYARLRHQRVTSNGTGSQGDRFMLRYYYEGDADHYMEANVSSGRSDDFNTAQLSGSRSDSRGLAWYHFVTRQWGFKVSASQANDTEVAGGKERSVNFGLAYRW